MFTANRASSEEVSANWQAAEEVIHRLPAALATTVIASTVQSPFLMAGAVGFVAGTLCQSATRGYSAYLRGEDLTAIDTWLPILGNSALDSFRTLMCLGFGSLGYRTISNIFLRNILVNEAVGFSYSGLDVLLYGQSDFALSDAVIWGASGLIGGAAGMSSLFKKRALAEFGFEYTREVAEEIGQSYVKKGQVTTAELIMATGMAMQEGGSKGVNFIRNAVTQTGPHELLTQAQLAISNWNGNPARYTLENIHRAREALVRAYEGFERKGDAVNANRVTELLAKAPFALSGGTEDKLKAIGLFFSENKVPRSVLNTSDELVIGRSDTSGLRVYDRYVSKRQAVIRHQGTWMIVNEGINPILVNNKPVHRGETHSLQLEDTIKIGESEWTIGEAVLFGKIKTLFPGINTFYPVFEAVPVALDAGLTPSDVVTYFTKMSSRIANKHALFSCFQSLTSVLVGYAHDNSDLDMEQVIDDIVTCENHVPLEDITEDMQPIHNTKPNLTLSSIRTNPPIGADTLLGVDENGHVKSEHNPDRNLVFISDAEIRHVTTPPRYHDHAMQGVPYGITRDGRYVLQQQGQRGCWAACVAMMVMQNGGHSNMDWVVSCNLSNEHVATRAIKEAGLPARLTYIYDNLSLVAKRLEDLIRKNGSGILSVGGEIGGHVVILDYLSVSEDRAVIRDPFHGWSIEISVDSLMRRVGMRTDFLQIKMPNLF